MSAEEQAKRIATRYLAKKTRRTKTAGEVRFIKDRGGDDKQWGWGTPGPTEREISADYKFDPINLRPLAQTLRATLMALGHATSAYNQFTKIKSARVSPDGSLGGRGYIQKIAEMRRAYMNCVEALSAISDTIYDEVNAPHWNPALAGQDPRERQKVQEIMEGVEEIREDPEDWAEEEQAEEDAEAGDALQKTATDMSDRLRRLMERRDPDRTSNLQSDQETWAMLDAELTDRVASRYLSEDR